MRKILLIALSTVALIVNAMAESLYLEDPIALAQRNATRSRVLFDLSTRTPIARIPADPIRTIQIMAVAERTFPNLAVELENAELLRNAAADPTLRGNLRGRLAEADYFRRNSSWTPVSKKNAPQNDGWRWVDGKIGGKMEGVQVKVHSDWRDYIPSMRKDNKAEHFAIPDDQYGLVYQELEKHRVGALRDGLSEKAAAYAKEQQRLAKLGRTFVQVDGAIGSAARHYGRIQTALRVGGKAAPFIGVALGLLDGGIAVHEVANGKISTGEFVERVSKAAVGGAASWAAGEGGAALAVLAGATGAVPVVVAVVVGTAVYFVVDWAIDTTAKSLKVARLDAADVAMLWPEGMRGSPIDAFLFKAKDANARAR